MSNFQPEQLNLASLLSNIYRCVDKSNWYNKVAAAYDNARPRYPASIIEALKTLAKLEPAKKVMEIGSGPGIATVDLAKTKIDLLFLEPSLSACKIAQKHCAAYSNVEFINSTFEAWELAQNKFDVVIATTSFHWITPGIRTQKIAAALKEQGQIVLMWNTPPQVSFETHQTIAHIYQTHMPNLAQYEAPVTHQKNLSQMGQELLDSGLFKNLQEEEVITQVIYSINDYLTLLSTLSPYISLETQKRNILFDELANILLLEYGNQLELSYLSMIQVAEKNLIN